MLSMKKTEARWIDVEVNDFVEDKTGKMWKVLGWDHVQAALQDADGQTARVRPSPYAEVVCYKRTMKDAVRVVESVLGGVVIEERNTSE